jgi:hypothetical protein
MLATAGHRRRAVPYSALGGLLPQVRPDAERLRFGSAVFVFALPEAAK